MPCGSICGSPLSYGDVEELLAERGLDVSMRRSVGGSTSSAPRMLATCVGCDPGRLDGSPKIHAPALNGDDHLVQVPCV
jgi:hypothetical protein